MKIIFLDIDGVISTESCLKDKKFQIQHNEHSLTPGKIIEMPYTWNQLACDSIKRIIDATDAKIILSSDWRLYYKNNDIEQIFHYYGVNNCIIYDKTGEEGKWSALKSTNRALQIRNSLQSIRELTNHIVESWVAVDDIDMREDLGDNFVWCYDIEIGIPSYEEEIITKLNKI